LRRSESPYVLQFTAGAVADIKTVVPKHLKGPLQKELLANVATDPVACSHELRDELAGYRSFPWREYRVVYKIFDDLRIIAVGGVGLRSAQSSENVYRKLERLARTGDWLKGCYFRSAA
jgi:mRNA-degrading endonuclease RelE of RelBE toxin-antitoxin system